MPLKLDTPMTVGAITAPNALRSTFTLDDCDLIELRLDALGGSTLLKDFCQRHQDEQVPLLLTARDPAEGGLNSLPLSQREDLLNLFLPFASAIDVELANYEIYGDLLNQAASLDVSIVLSSHNFESFHHIQTLEKITAAEQAGASIAKVAVTLLDSMDLTLYEALCADLSGQPVAIMGMGKYGPVSRILAAQHGSLLNYGYLGDEPTAPGQWPARILKQAIANTPPILNS